jgi:hypothetical protein
LSSRLFALPGGANSRLKDVGETTTYWGCLRGLKSETSVPMSAIGHPSTLVTRCGRYIQFYLEKPDGKNIADLRYATC